MGLAIAIIFIAIGLLVTMVLSYLLRSPALYRMLKNAGVAPPILAWVPIANEYCLGLLCERASYHRAGSSWKYSVFLPLSKVVLVLVYVIPFTSEFGVYLSPFINIVNVAWIVVTAIALYNLYWDYAQGNEVLYLVIGMVCGSIARAIVLLVIRNRVPMSVQFPQYSRHTNGYSYGTPRDYDDRRF